MAEGCGAFRHLLRGASSGHRERFLVPLPDPPSRPLLRGDCLDAPGSGAGGGRASPLVSGGSGGSRGSTRRGTPVPSLDAEQRVQGDGFCPSIQMEMNQAWCYDMIEEYCDFIGKQLSSLQKQRECPQESREAVSTLIFAASRFPDLPELCKYLRHIFTGTYGSLEPFISHELRRLRNIADCEQSIFEFLLLSPSIGIQAEPPAQVRQRKCRQGAEIVEDIEKRPRMLPKDTPSTEFEESSLAIHDLWLNFFETSALDHREVVLPLARSFQWIKMKGSIALSAKDLCGIIGRANIDIIFASVAKDGKIEIFTASGLDYTNIPNVQIRKVTANSGLLASKQTIPHYNLALVDNLLKLRGELNPLQEASGGKKISINDLVIKVAALALRKVPQCKSSWMNDIIHQYNNMNINVAVQTEHGLFVPVFRDADKKGLGTVSEEVKQFAQRARDNSLKPQNHEGGKLTVSKLGGPFGIKQFCAIINPPQLAILAISSAENRVIPGGSVLVRFLHVSNNELRSQGY